jgi:hypothetical protein
MRGFHDLLRQNLTSVHFVGMELNLNGHSNDVIHVLDLGGEDGHIVKLNVVSQVDAVFRHG